MSSNVYWPVRTRRKNATLESIEKISLALNVSLSKLLEMIGGNEDDTVDYSHICYDIISAKSSREQEQIYRILIDLENYKNN